MKKLVARYARSTAVAALNLTPPRANQWVRFLASQHAFPHFDDPKSFTEKVKWRMLYDRRPLIAETCDKLRVKEIATEHGIATPQTLWAGTDLSNVPRLEGDWVLKPNHRSGAVIFGHGPADVAHLRPRVRGWLEEYPRARSGEWAYTQARRAFVIERRLGEGARDLPDYKFFVFNGTCRLIQVDSDRSTEHGRHLYSPAWEALDLTYHYPRSEAVAPPASLEAMRQAAEQVGKEFDFIRVDLYEHEETVFLGELTPYPGGGNERFSGVGFDAELGSHWKLPALSGPGGEHGGQASRVGSETAQMDSAVEPAPVMPGACQSVAQPT